LTTALTKDLNYLIRQPEFYDSGPFTKRQWPAVTVKVLEKLSPLDARMIRNRLVLQAEYPEAIEEHPFEVRAALILRSSYEKNYDTHQWKELTSEEVQKLPVGDRDRLSRRPLSAEQVRALISTALEMHTRLLAQQQELRDLRAEVRANQETERAERAAQSAEIQAMRQEARAQAEEARAQAEEARAAWLARVWWIPLAVGILSFVGAILGAILKPK
jgi:hypothetical protein